MAVSIISSYGVLTFCGKTAVLNCSKWYNQNTDNQVEVTTLGDSSNTWNLAWNSRNVFHYSLTVFWVVGSISIGLYVPDISSVISLIGNLAAAFIFIFPGLVSIKAQLRGNSRVKQLVLPIAMVVFGIMLMGVCLTLTIQKFRKGEKFE